MWWVRRFVGECHMCGRDTGFTERVPADVEPKPAEQSKRVIVLDGPACYCGCMERDQ